VSHEKAGMEQAAQAMLRTVGAGSCWLLVPQPVTANAQTGLGLSAPLVNEVEVEPVLLQTNATGKTLLARLTHGTVQKALNSMGAIDSDENATEETLERSMLRANGTEYRIVSVTVKWFGGVQLLYELEIEE
jgi:hypothetical protein